MKVEDKAFIVSHLVAAEAMLARTIEAIRADDDRNTYFSSIVSRVEQARERYDNPTE